MRPLHEPSDVNLSIAPAEHAYAMQSAQKYNMTVRGTVLMGFREAALASWGEAGLQQIGALLSEPARRDTVDVAAVSIVWMPETYVLEWYRALWYGPCGSSRDAFRRFLDRMIDAGFGRVRKMLVALASPETILQKAPNLWQHDHSHGTLSVVAIEADSAKVSLTDHPYTETSIARVAIAEIYRYCLQLCRTGEVVEVHYREPNGTFIVCLRWAPR